MCGKGLGLIFGEGRRDGTGLCARRCSVCLRVVPSGGRQTCRRPPAGPVAPRPWNGRGASGRTLFRDRGCAARRPAARAAWSARAAAGGRTRGVPTCPGRSPGTPAAPGALARVGRARMRGGPGGSRGGRPRAAWAAARARPWQSGPVRQGPCTRGRGAGGGQTVFYMRAPRRGGLAHTVGVGGGGCAARRSAAGACAAQLFFLQGAARGGPRAPPRALPVASGWGACVLSSAAACT